MAFSTNYENIGGSELLPAGWYEVIIKSAGPNVTKNGIPYLDIRMVIRNDVEQSYGNKYIFHSIWQKKEPNERDNEVEGYSYKQLMQLAEAAKFPSGKEYATVEDLLADLVGKCVKVQIVHDEYNGNVNVRVKFCDVTKFPDCRHVWKEAAKPVTGSTYQPPKQDAFAQPASAAAAVDLSDFEEIGSSDIPF